MSHGGDIGARTGDDDRDRFPFGEVLEVPDERGDGGPVPRFRSGGFELVVPVGYRRVVEGRHVEDTV